MIEHLIDLLFFAFVAVIIVVIAMSAAHIEAWAS